ncbi:MAG: hypothetical protein AAF938_28925 [Myxococcota bacterium]
MHCSSQGQLVVTFPSGTTREIDDGCEFISSLDGLLVEQQGQIGELRIDALAETVDFEVRRALPQHTDIVPASTEWLLLGAPPGCPASHCWFDVITGEQIPVDASYSEALPGLREVFLRVDDAWHRVTEGTTLVEPLPAPFDTADIVVAGDGSVWSHERTDDGEVRSLLRLDHDEHQIVPVPDGCRTYWVESDVAVVTREHTTGVHWRTEDSGRSWRQLRPDPRVRGYRDPGKFDRLSGYSCRTPCETDDGLVADASPSFRDSIFLGTQARVSRPAHLPPSEVVCRNDGPTISGESSASGYFSLVRRGGRDVVRWRGIDRRGAFVGEASDEPRRGAARPHTANRQAMIYSMIQNEPWASGWGRSTFSLRAAFSDGSTVELANRSPGLVLLRADGSGVWAGASTPRSDLGAWDARGNAQGPRLFGARAFPALIDGRPAAFFPRDPDFGVAGSIAFLDPETPPSVIELSPRFQACTGPAEEDTTMFAVYGSRIGLEASSVLLASNDGHLCIRALELHDGLVSTLTSSPTGGFKGFRTDSQRNRISLRIEQADLHNEQTYWALPHGLNRRCFDRVPEFEGTIHLRGTEASQFPRVRGSSLSRELRRCIERTLEDGIFHRSVAGDSVHLEVRPQPPAVLHPVHCTIQPLPPEQG